MKSQSGAPRRGWLSQVMTISCRSSGISTSVHPALFMPLTQVKLTTKYNKSTEVTGLTGYLGEHLEQTSPASISSPSMWPSPETSSLETWWFRPSVLTKKRPSKLSKKHQEALPHKGVNQGLCNFCLQPGVQKKGLQIAKSVVVFEHNLLMRTKTPTAKQASGAEKQWSAASPV